MPASDPTADVPTPTGTLQGVAAFSWDGTNWQPTGRAGPSVATPTGVLRGVAAFNGGPAWQPSGLAQPGVATPSGTLDGVAVYTWSGAAWTPPGGTATPSTPHGALRGVAAFNWDGAVWQPASQAGPSVATPYGVLDGVAMFGWSGSAWAAVGAPSLSLDFMTPGTLDPRITFTRASTATYFDATGTMRTAATNVPRWDYDPNTLALRGLLIEEPRTNIILQSADVSNAAWAKSSAVVAAPTVTGNQVAAPDGTITAARVVYPAISGGGAQSVVAQGIGVSAAAYTFSAWLRGNAGGERLYLNTTADGVTYYRTAVTLTTAWQRFTLTTAALTATTWYFQIGADLRDGSETSTPAQTIFVWGAQLELGGFPTSYIPTTAAAATRAFDYPIMATSPWYNQSVGSTAVRFIDGGWPAGSAHNAGIAAFDDGAGNGQNAIDMFGYNNASTYMQPNIIVNVAGTTTGSFAAGNVNLAGANYTKVAWSWGGSVLAISCNGSAPAAGAVTGLPATISRLTLGSGYGGVGQLNGYLQNLSYWPRVLTNAEMQAVTT